MNKELIDLLENASKGSRHLDEAVAEALGLKPFRSPRAYRPDEIRIVSSGKARNLPRITTSIDAALALAESQHDSMAALAILYESINCAAKNAGCAVTVPMIVCAVLLANPPGSFAR
jgi:hypothetical protein